MPGGQCQMKIAYLVFAYKNPRLLARIIERLSCDDCSFFIHIDAKSNLDDFAAIKGRNIFFTEKRVPVYWAEFSGIEAILILIREALAHPRPHDYFVLLSGSEYPLKSREYIHRFLEENRGAEFLSLVKMPNAQAGKPISRINTMRIQSHRPMYRFVVRILAKLGLAQRDHRKCLGNLEPYSGHTWWALTKEACQYIDDFVRRNQRMVRYFEDTYAPEEMFFHTILGNSPFRSRTRRNLFYEDWSEKGSHPAMISEKHIAAFAAQERVVLEDAYGRCELLFARKFSDDGWEMVRRIDEMICLREKQQTQPARSGA
jgi:hypothetical protein